MSLNSLYEEDIVLGFPYQHFLFLISLWLQQACFHFGFISNVLPASHKEMCVCQSPLLLLPCCHSRAKRTNPVALMRHSCYGVWQNILYEADEQWSTPIQCSTMYIDQYQSILVKIQIWHRSVNASKVYNWIGIIATPLVAWKVVCFIVCFLFSPSNPFWRCFSVGTWPAKSSVADPGPTSEKKRIRISDSG